MGGVLHAIIKNCIFALSTLLFNYNILIVMRKLILLLIIAIATNAMAYTPMVVDGYSWNVVCPWDYTGDNREGYTTHVEKIEGDSIIGGVTYKKLWRYYPSNPEKRFLEGLLREDVEAQKVWAYGNGIETLMYDFDVEAGDTISLLSWLHFMKNIKIEDLTDGYTITDLVVDKVEMVDIEGLGAIKRLKLYEAKYPSNKSRKFYIYERFGSLCGWTFSDFAEVEGGGGNTVLCVFDADGELIFKPKTGNNILDNDQDCIVDTSFVFVPSTYKPMLMPGYSWNVVNRRVLLDENNTVEYKTYSEKITDYEYVDDKFCWTLYRSTDDELLEYEFVAHLCENAHERQVSALIGGEEYLLYDFGCEVGDTIEVLKSLASARFKPEMIKMTIKNIEEIEDLTWDTIRKFVATIEDFPFDVVYYERYGSENGWYTRPYDGIVGGGIDFLFCAWGVQQNYLLFKPDHNNELDKINACYLNETRTNIADVDFLSNEVYYNGENETLMFDVENVTDITIYDAMGKIVVNRELTAGVKAISLDLNMGVYIVCISTDKPQYFHSKIVVK